MTGQNDAAAERSAHERDPDAGRCFVCGGPWQKGGASWAVRVLPPMVQVCSATCAMDDRFSLGEEPDEARIEAREREWRDYQAKRQAEAEAEAERCLMALAEVVGVDAARFIRDRVTERKKP